MANRVRRILPAILGAVLLNVALLLILTQLSRERPVKAEFSDAVPIRLVHRDPPEELEEIEHEPPKPPKPKQKPEFTPELLQPALARFGAPEIGVVVDPGRFDSPQDGEFVFGMEEVDQVAVPIVETTPIYPERALRRFIEGKVLVRFLVMADGSVQNIEIVEARPEGLFEEAVLKAAATWKFRPGKVNGRPVNSWWQREVAFEIDP